jgi:NADH-quinone oxidoreductase subunit L
MNFLPDYSEHPGLLFVTATLVPLAAFLLILLACGAWALLRPYRDTPLGGKLYELFGGDKGGRTAAFVATGAIAIACVCSISGFIKYSDEQARFEDEITRLRKLPEASKKKLAQRRVPDALATAAIVGQAGPLSTAAWSAHIYSVLAERAALERATKAAPERLEQVERRWEDAHAMRWKGQVTWVQLHSPTAPDPERGTRLELGFSVDSLTCLMFVMVTFIATLIHVFSIGYMSEELPEVVEDHQVHTAGGHLHRRGRFGRFFMFMSLFCFSMLNLILADNLFQVFISWELVGICSYLLIGFYFERQSASNAANKAFITNRIGDAGFIIGMMIVWTYLGTFNFEEMFRQVRAPVEHGPAALKQSGRFVRGTLEKQNTDGSQVLRVADNGPQVILFPRAEAAHEREHGEHAEASAADKTIRSGAVDVYAAPKADQHSSIPYWLMVAAGLGIFLGCVGKSAQFPLQVWLPDAMEGPTPVSALIHAATMVAAGVYLVGRVYPLFTLDVLLVIAYVGGITLFVAASIAVVMTDIKKVLAYSTVSQLGYMMLALGVGGWVAGLFHLVTHAFFKALLFLGSGAVIYGCHHEQDMRKMGGLYSKMPITALTMLMGLLAIAGIPLFTGWYSKDAILAQAFGFAAVHRTHLLLFILPLVTAGLTAFYMLRMWLMTFTGQPRDEHVYEHAKEAPEVMTWPLVILAVCSVCVAWGWPIWDAEASALQHNIHHAQPTSVLADFGHVVEENEVWEIARESHLNERANAAAYHSIVGAIALGLVLVGIVFAYNVYYRKRLDPEEAKAQFPKLHAFLENKWRFDELYSVMLVRPTLVVARWLATFDLVVIDGIIHLLAWLTIWLSRWDGRFDNGVVDGLVNLVAKVCYGVGGGLRRVQTGLLRSYVLFLALAAVVIFVLLTYLVSLAWAG